MDRRQHVRRTFPGSGATVQLATDTQTAPEHVEVLDVSESGLRLIYRRDVPALTACQLIIQAHSGQWMRVRGSVVRCDPVPDAADAWYVALQFASHIPITELLDVDRVSVSEKVA